MLNFIKKFIAKIEAARIDRENSNLVDKQGCERNLAEAKYKMAHKYCAIHRNVCFGECVHYKRGKVFYMPPFGHVSGGWNWISPKCKLWG